MGVVELVDRHLRLNSWQLRAKSWEAFRLALGCIFAESGGDGADGSRCGNILQHSLDDIVDHLCTFFWPF
jgi:hypothetical protein